MGMRKNSMTEFGEKLKSLRRKAGYTQAEAARRLEISASTVGMYEQGRREPDLESMQKICKLYGINLNYFSEGDSSAPQEIEDMIESMREQMKQSDGIMFDGVPVSSEDTEKIFDAMLLAAKLIMTQHSESGKTEEWNTLLKNK